MIVDTSDEDDDLKSAVEHFQVVICGLKREDLTPEDVEALRELYRMLLAWHQEQGTE
jgi:acyl-[acyl carrier protein]--UDP-N-acetylglucosamine O-acyltransferase